MSGDNTNGDNTTPRDNRQTIIIVLAVVLTILVGLVVGFLASGGLSGDPAAAPTTTPATAYLGRLTFDYGGSADFTD